MGRTRVQRWLRTTWPLAQQSAAAAVAWLIAVRVAGHEHPFFAPVAAVVGLNATLGRRGSNAVRLLTGVLVGVVVGEVAVELAGAGVWSLAGATFVAMLIARTVDDALIVRAQAAVSAILVTVLDRPEQGWERSVDAVIGAGVALAFSQVLFAPEPLRLLRRAEATVLSALASGLRLTSEAMALRDPARAQTATAQLRDLRDDLATLSTKRKASERITRHTLPWRRRANLVVAEREHADDLDLLAGSCLMLARTAPAVEGRPRARLAATVANLAAELEHLAADPGDQATRQGVTERAAELIRWLVEHEEHVAPQSALAAAYASVGMVAADVMVFAGVDPPEAYSAAHPSTRQDE